MGGRLSFLERVRSGSFDGIRKVDRRVSINYKISLELHCLIAKECPSAIVLLTIG